MVRFIKNITLSGVLLCGLVLPVAGAFAVGLPGDAPGGGFTAPAVTLPAFMIAQALVAEREQAELVDFVAAVAGPAEFAEFEIGQFNDRLNEADRQITIRRERFEQILAGLPVGKDRLKGGQGLFGGALVGSFALIVHPSRTVKLEFFPAGQRPRVVRYFRAAVLDYYSLRNGYIPDRARVKPIAARFPSASFSFFLFSRSLSSNNFHRSGYFIRSGAEFSNAPVS